MGIEFDYDKSSMFITGKIVQLFVNEHNLSKKERKKKKNNSNLLCLKCKMSNNGCEV